MDCLWVLDRRLWQKPLTDCIGLHQNFFRRFFVPDEVASLILFQGQNEQ